MAKVVKVRLGRKVCTFDEAALKVLPRATQIEIAVALGLKLRRGISKAGLVQMILAKA